jgi:hypothetical protein
MALHDLAHMNPLDPATPQVNTHAGGSPAPTAVDLTCQHKNQTLLVEGPEIKIRPVGTRRVTVVLDKLHYDHRWVDAVQAMELVCNVYGVDYLPCRALLIEDQGLRPRCPRPGTKRRYGLA